MTWLWNFKAMKGRQLLWTAVFSWTFCVLTLLGNQVAGDSVTVSTDTSTATKLETTSSPAPTKEAVDHSNAIASTLATPTVSSENSHIIKENHMTNATSSPTALSKLISTTVNQTVQPSLTQENASHAVNNETTAAITPTIFPTSMSTEKPKFSDSPTPAKTGNSSLMHNLTCVDIKQVTTDKVICLELNEPYSCQKFIQEKGAAFAKVICENQISCKIKLAESVVNRKCILLVEDSNKGTHELDAVLQENKFALKQDAIQTYLWRWCNCWCNCVGCHNAAVKHICGTRRVSGCSNHALRHLCDTLHSYTSSYTSAQAIIPHEQEVIGNHYQKSPSRKTLIALVTSGLLLAFLGLTAYFLMKRRSWSPMGERLADDPIDPENGSHGNTDLQDKPNLNGGSRENGTGQPASKNGHSTRAHVVADTEL